MAEASIFDESVLEFRDKYLRNRRDVSVYRKLGTYTRIGLYTTGILTYIFLAMFLTDDFARNSPQVIGSGGLTLISGVLTVLFWQYKREEYNFDEIDLVYHEVAAFIDDVEKNTDEEILNDSAERFDEYVIQDDDGVLPKIWRDELRDYFDYAYESDTDVSESMNTVFSRLVEDMEILSDVDFSEEFTDEEGSHLEEEEPGFVGVFLETVKSDVVSRQALIWIIFMLAVTGGLALAFFQGQGWGVLLVTIVFGGLRLYDQSGE